MKKAFRALSLLFVASMMLFALSACGADKTPAATTPPPATTDKTYTIASDSGFAPFEFMDVASNTYVGLDMDLLAAIAADQGFKYKMDNVGFDAALLAVQGGQADAMIAGMSITEDRLKDYDFSDGYYASGQIMVVGKDSAIATLEDLRGKVVATKAGTQGSKYAESMKAQYGFTTAVYEDSPTMYTAVAQGSNAACFEDRAVAIYSIKSQNLALKTVGDEISPKDYGFAVKKGNYPELIEMFNKGLENIKKNGTYDNILAKYGL